MMLGNNLFLVLGIFIFLVIVFLYNLIIFKVNSVNRAWAQINIQLKRRHDLIPNLVEVAKAYIAHEAQTLEKVTLARAQALGAQGIKDKIATENFLTQSLRSFFMVMEDYPHLKANRNMLNLQEELTSTENRIALSRQFYNDETTKYNTLIQKFPSNLIAPVFSFKKKDLFEIENPSHRERPEVNF